MIYEQLQALGDQIGTVKVGVGSPTSMSQAMIERPFAGESDALKGEDASCTICMEEYNEGDNLGVLKFLHAFHKDCVTKWLKDHITCPVCQTELK